MEPLSPKHVAFLAQQVYRLTHDDVSRVADTEANNFFSIQPSARFKGVTGCDLFQKESGFGYVAKGTGPRSGEALIAIRGTEGFLDWVTDFNASREEGPCGNQVHAGFNRVFKSFKEQIDKSLNSIGPSGVHIVGHSLGGALANITADYLSEKGVAIKVSLVLQELLPMQ